MAKRPAIDLKLTLDGRPVHSETTYTWAGAHVLVLHTVLPRPDLALELHSTFTGHCGVPTRSMHLVLGPPGHAPVIVTAEHAHELLGPTLPRGCAYEHAHQLIEVLDSLGYQAAVRVAGERAFAALEQAEQP